MNSAQASQRAEVCPSVERVGAAALAFIGCAAGLIGCLGAAEGAGTSPIRHLPGDQPSVIINLTELLESPPRRARTYRSSTPQGPVSVTFHPPRDSGLPPARQAQISWPISHYVAVIRSPQSLPLKVWLPVWSNHSRRQVQVNAHDVALRAGVEPLGHWTGKFPGGYNKVVIPVTTRNSRLSHTASDDRIGGEPPA